MTQLKNIYSQIARYKGHHILFWTVYHFFWWLIYVGGIFTIFEKITEPHNLIKFLGYVIYQAFAVYFCLYYLIPNYLEKRKYVTFFLGLTGVIFVTASLITANYFIAASVEGTSVYDLFKISPRSPITIFKQNALASTIASLTLGMSIKLSKNWLAAQKQQQELQKEKLETELKFLRSQFNPHFLFNTINSIFVLIHKNTEMASESLVKFSNLLRYQLYECNADVIPLKNELAYVQSFIELESLRQNTDFQLTENYPNTTNNLMIAPFILIPFIENAFKHVAEDSKAAKWIHVEVKVTAEKLKFHVTNSADKGMQNTLLNETVYKGLGLKNVKRRLDLLYANKYDLQISKEQDSFTASLEIDLENQANLNPNKLAV